MKQGRSTMKNLTIQDILGIEDKKIEPLDIPEWEGTVYLRIMSAQERSELEDIFIKMKANAQTGKFRKEMLKRTLVDVTGQHLISDDAVATHVMKKNALVIESIFEKACEVNGFRERDVETLKKK